MPATSFSDVGRELLRVVDGSAADLARITDADAIQPRAAGKWSRKQILGHLIDSASNNHQRFVRGVEGRGGEFPTYNLQISLSSSCGRKRHPVDGDRRPLVQSTIAIWRTCSRSCPREGAAHTMRVGTNPETTPLLFIASDYVEHLKHHVNQIIGHRFPSQYPGKGMNRRIDPGARGL